MPWEQINDGRVRHVWRDPVTSEEVTVGPDYYAENGEPTNELGDDYDYVRTEILGPEDEKSADPPVRNAEEVAAEVVRDAAATLNRMIHEATKLGLRVEVEVHEYNVISGRFPQPRVSASIMREL